MIYDHWYGMVAPAATPKAVVDQISAEVGRILRMPEVVKSFSDQGVIAAPTSPADFNKFIALEIQRLGTVAKSANIQIEWMAGSFRANAYRPAPNTWTQ